MRPWVLAAMAPLFAMMLAFAWAAQSSAAVPADIPAILDAAPGGGSPCETVVALAGLADLGTFQPNEYAALEKTSGEVQQRCLCFHQAAAISDDSQLDSDTISMAYPAVSAGGHRVQTRFDCAAPAACTPGACVQVQASATVVARPVAAAVKMRWETPWFSNRPRPFKALVAKRRGC